MYLLWSVNCAGFEFKNSGIMMRLFGFINVSATEVSVSKYNKAISINVDKVYFNLSSYHNTMYAK